MARNLGRPLERVNGHKAAITSASRDESKRVQNKLTDVKHEKEGIDEN
jgi:hypothetical protein